MDLSGGAHGVSALRLSTAVVAKPHCRTGSSEPTPPTRTLTLRSRKGRASRCAEAARELREEGILHI